MISYKWSILEVFGDGEFITKARYKLTASKDGNTVETEGYWDFPIESNKKSFQGILESDIANWVDEASTIDGKNLIKFNLEDQLLRLQNSDLISKPWALPTFKLKI